MPDIALLEPQVLRGLVEKFTTPETLQGLSMLPRESWPFPTAKWDVIRGSRNVAKPNVPNSEAHIVPKLGMSQESAAFIYLREKKVFEPTTIHWLREPGQMASKNAERAVLREIRDLDIRFNNFAEWCIWKMLQGSLVLDYPDVQATIDYKIPASHKPTPGVLWSSATAAQIIADVQAWKRLIARDGRVPATTVFLTELNLQRVYTAFAAGGAAAIISDRQKDQYTTTGTLTGLLGLNWITVEGIYETDVGTQTLFLPDDIIILCNPTENSPIKLLEGPTADDEAPNNYIGKFAKTWKEKDPSARQYLLEWHFLPIMERPEQFVVADVA